MSKKIKIQGYTVLIKPKKIEEVSEGGILIARTSQSNQLEQHKMLEGVVVQLGDLAFTDKVNRVTEEVGKKWCDVGDTVYYRQYAAKFIPDPNDPDNKDLYLAVLSDEDIIATIVEEE